MHTHTHTSAHTSAHLFCHTLFFLLSALLYYTYCLLLAASQPVNNKYIE